MTTFVAVTEVPQAGEFCQLRVDGGLSAMDTEAAAVALPHSLFATTIRDNDRLIAMARVVGDGLHVMITDVVVHPDYQGQGLAKKLLDRVIEFVDNELPSCAWVNLFADVDWLYGKYGFEVNTTSIGMTRPRNYDPAT